MPVGGVHSIQVAAVPFTDLIANTQAGDLTSPIRMVAHILGAREEVINLLWAAPANNFERQAIILEVSSQEATSSLSAVNGNIVWLSMKSRAAYKKVSDWLPQFLALDFETAKTIAVAEERGSLSTELQRKFAHLLDITHPGDPTAELAFRLLCEARVACETGGATEQFGITIHPPTGLEAWLVPFSPQGNTDEERIAAVVAVMGSTEAKAAAEMILLAAKKGENGLNEAKAFPGVPAPVSNSTPTQEGGAA